MMPHPERAVDDILGGSDGLKIISNQLLNSGGNHMSSMLEPNPEQIKAEKIIRSKWVCQMKNSQWLKKF